MIRITDGQISKFKEFLEQHDSFLIAGHKEPDGDCVSSCIGLSYIVEKYGKPYVMLNAGPFKRNEIKKYAEYYYIYSSTVLILFCKYHINHIFYPNNLLDFFATMSYKSR